MEKSGSYAEFCHRQAYYNCLFDLKWHVAGVSSKGGELGSGSSSLSLVQETTQDPGGHPQQLPGEDLRAYAYEGDGSSSGSLTSTISG